MALSDETLRRIVDLTVEGRAMDEVAACLGMSEGTLRRRLHERTGSSSVKPLLVEEIRRLRHRARVIHVDLDNPTPTVGYSQIRVRESIAKALAEFAQAEGTDVSDVLDQLVMLGQRRWRK